MTKSQLAAWKAAYDPKNRAFEDSNLSDKERIFWQYQRYVKDYLRGVASVDDNIGRSLRYLENDCSVRFPGFGPGTERIKRKNLHFDASVSPGYGPPVFIARLGRLTNPAERFLIKGMSLYSFLCQAHQAVRPILPFLDRSHPND